jgi:hypothetical protein
MLERLVKTFSLFDLYNLINITYCVRSELIDDPHDFDFMTRVCPRCHFLVFSPKPEGVRSASKVRRCRFRRR